MWSCAGIMCAAVVFSLLHSPPMTNTAFFGPLWYICAIPAGKLLCGSWWDEYKGKLSNVMLPFHMILFGALVGLDDQ